MSQPQPTNQGGIPPFLPGLILIGIFALVLAILTPRGETSTPLRNATGTPHTASVSLPTATLSLSATPVPATAEVDSPAATPGNVLTAIAVGAGPQASTSVPTQSGDVGASATSSADSPIATPGNVLTAIAVGAGPQASASIPTQSGDAGASTTSSVASPSPTPSAVVATEVAATPPTAEAAAVVADPAMADQGAMVYQTSCAACHGFDAHGIPGLGKDLVTSAFVHGLSDADLLHFIIVGRETSDPLNTTGIMMPARGGNSALTDEQLLAIIAYLRSIAAPS